ncbi:MAG TPA: potassium-transporting ATPase subunit C [Pseudonocardiaceae bacterium]|nr:potassium-transporting ATPase subunit C [Pseudonocardiaceae bacterium]
MIMVFRQTWAAVRLLIVLVVLTGVIYPLAVWAVSRTPGLESQAEGSIVTYDGRPIGSSLIGVNLVGDQYFYGRPSAQASDYSATDTGKLGLAGNDPSSSSASNLSQDSATLAAQIAARKAVIAQREGVNPSQVPPDAVTASASGVDPDISPAYADLQAARVARANHLSPALVHQIIAANVRGRALGVLGDPTVNVQAINLAVARAVQAAER